MLSVQAITLQLKLLTNLLSLLLSSPHRHQAPRETNTRVRNVSGLRHRAQMKNWPTNKKQSSSHSLQPLHTRSHPTLNLKRKHQHLLSREIPHLKRNLSNKRRVYLRHLQPIHLPRGHLQLQALTLSLTSRRQLRLHSQPSQQPQTCSILVNKTMCPVSSSLLQSQKELLLDVMTLKTSLVKLTSLTSLPHLGTPHLSLRTSTTRTSNSLVTRTKTRRRIRTGRRSSRSLPWYRETLQMTLLRTILWARVSKISMMMTFSDQVLLYSCTLAVCT